MIFALVQDFTEIRDAMPHEHPRYRILQLLDEAIRRDVNFIDRHPTTFFQCLWNTCWWYDCPQAEKHYYPRPNRLANAAAGKKHGAKLYRLLETWQETKQSAQKCCFWVRSLRPPPVALGTPLEMTISLGGVSQMRGSSVFSLDGNKLICAVGSLQRWDLETGAAQVLNDVWAGAELNDVSDVAYSRNGEFVMAGTDNDRVCCWDAHTGRLLNRFDGVERSHFTSLAFASQRCLLASILGHRILIWDAIKGSQVAILEGTGRFWSVAFSADETKVVAGSGIDGSVVMWDVASGKKLAETNLPGQVFGIACSPCGRWIAAGAGGDVCVLHADSLQQKVRCSGHDDTVWSLAFTPDGEFLASGSGNSYGIGDSQSTVGDTSIRVWQISDGSELGKLQNHRAMIQHLIFSPDGKHLASVAADGKVCVWNIRRIGNLRSLCGHQDHINSVVFSPSGSRLLTGSGSMWGSRDNTVRVWDVAEGFELAVLEGREYGVTDVAWSPDENEVAACGWGSEIHVWDWELQTIRCRFLTPNDGVHELVRVEPEAPASLSHGVNGVSYCPQLRQWLTTVFGLCDAQTLPPLTAADKKQLTSTSEELIKARDTVVLFVRSNDETQFLERTSGLMLGFFPEPINLALGPSGTIAAGPEWKSGKYLFIISMEGIPEAASDARRDE